MESFTYTLGSAVFRVTVRSKDQSVRLATLNDADHTLIQADGEFRGVMLTPIEKGLVIGVLVNNGNQYQARAVIEYSTGEVKRMSRHWHLNTAGELAHDENTIVLSYDEEDGLFIMDVRNPKTVIVQAPLRV